MVIGDILYGGNDDIPLERFRGNANRLNCRGLNFPAATAAYFGMETENQEPIVIPHRELSAEALRGVLESFVLREGTDYGERAVSLDQKVAEVLHQLERGEAQIVFNAALQSIDIIVSKSDPARSR